MDFQLYDYTENNFSNERFHELKTTWAIPSDGSMESNEEYFNWSNDLKLVLGTTKQYTVSEAVTDTAKYSNNSSSNGEQQQPQKTEKKRKCFASSSDHPAKKIQIVETLKDPLELEPSSSSSSSSTLNAADKQVSSADKRDTANGEFL